MGIYSKATLGQCQAACAGGTKAIEAFCRSIQNLHPTIRALCWSNSLLGGPACSGFCLACFKFNCI